MKATLFLIVFSFAQHAYAEDLPSKFDLRNVDGKNLVSEVKSQTGGTCWTHAAMAAIESNLMVTTVWSQQGETGEPDLAEYHLDWWNGFNLHKNHDVSEPNGLTVHEGGDYRVAAAYLSRGGAVRDIDGQSYNKAPAESAATFHRYYPRDIVWFDAGKNLENINAIKKSLMEHGAMGTALAWSNSFYKNGSFYQPPTNPSAPNHAVTIVGWDDDKRTSAPRNGAWLIKNSWGPAWGQGGYFWISYYDKTSGHHGEMGAVAFQNTVRFTYYRVYSHDLHGWRDTKKEVSEAMNRFTAIENEDLRSVSFYTTADNTDFSVIIYSEFDGGVLHSPITAPLEGSFEHRGFHTIDLPFPITLKAGKKFHVYLRVSQGGMAYDRTSEVPVLLGSRSRVTVKSTAAAGESYFKKDGVWHDLTEDNLTANFCIKALTDKI